MEYPSPETFFAGAELDAARAIAAGNPAELERTLTFKLVNVNAEGTGGMSLLLFALSAHQHACLHVLLRWRANPNQASALGQGEFAQPVALAAGYNDVEQLRILLAHGGDPNSLFLGESALFRAISTFDWPALHLLAEQRGINLNLAKPDGATPILLLAYLNQFEQVAYLLDKGADFKKADESGGTVAFTVQTRKLDPDGPTHRWQQRVKLLLEQGGVQFPVADPSVEWEKKRVAEEKLRQQWGRTAAGRKWNDAVHQANDDGDDEELLRAQEAAQAAFEHWEAQQAGPTNPAPGVPAPAPTVE